MQRFFIIHAAHSIENALVRGTLNGTKIVQVWALGGQVQSPVARRLYRAWSIPIMIQKEVLEFFAFLALSDDDMLRESGRFSPRNNTEHPCD
jgi:hypothetical protein